MEVFLEIMLAIISSAIILFLLAFFQNMNDDIEQIKKDVEEIKNKLNL